MVILYIAAGIIGCALFHIYWMLNLAKQANGKAIDNNPNDGRFRLKILMLNIMSGATSGFIVWLWFLNQTNIPSNQIIVIAFIAGLSGEGFLGLIRKMLGLP